jgi:hypothetical protein
VFNINTLAETHTFFVQLFILSEATCFDPKQNFYQRRTEKNITKIDLYMRKHSRQIILFWSFEANGTNI